MDSTKVSNCVSIGKSFRLSIINHKELLPLQPMNPPTHFDMFTP